MTNIKEGGGKEEAEVSASILQENLRKFADLDDTHDRGDAIADLISLIKEHANQESLGLLVNEEFQPTLQESVKKALETPFVVEGEEVIPWSGGFTIVALSLTGKVRGAISKPTKGLESYGDLYPYALTKAVLAFQLWKNSKLSPGNELGIGNLKEYEYLTSVAKTHIYNGAAILPAYLEDSMSKAVYIGGSGCAVKEDYLKGLLGGAAPTPDTQAGRFDAIFCELVRNYLTGKEVHKMPEPRDVREIRINN